MGGGGVKSLGVCCGPALAVLKVGEDADWRRLLPLVKMRMKDDRCAQVGTVSS